MITLASPDLPESSSSSTLDAPLGGPVWYAGTQPAGPRPHRQAYLRSDERLLKFIAVAQLSAARKVAIAGRVATRMAGRNRWLRAGLSGAGVVLRSLGSTLAVLWQQVTGVFFLAFALVGSFAAVREYHAYADGRMGPGRAVLAAVFAVLFGYFAISNFARAGRRS